MGTRDLGKLYENVVVASVAVKLTNDTTIENYHISANDGAYGKFDDLVVKIKFDKIVAERVIAVQLKHSENETPLSRADFKKKDFNIRKYFESFKALKERPDKAILFTNRPFECNDNTIIRINQGEKNISIKPVKVTAASELFEESESIYKFEIVKVSLVTENNPPKDPQGI